MASAESSLSNKLKQCGKISSSEERLACFDSLITADTQEPVLIKEATVAVVSTENVTTKEVDDFAKNHLKKTTEEQGLESISSTVTQLKKLIKGQWVIDLENGQRWQQKDSAKIKLKVGNTVRLKKGAMGAVYLYKEGSHRNIRVKRLK